MSNNALNVLFRPVYTRELVCKIRRTLFFSDSLPRFLAAILHRFPTCSKFRAPQRRFKKPANTALESRTNWAESAASFAIFNTSFSATKAHENSAPWLTALITFQCCLVQTPGKKEIDSPSNSIVRLAFHQKRFDESFKLLQFYNTGFPRSAV